MYFTQSPAERGKAAKNAKGKKTFNLFLYFLGDLCGFA
jgi:hypothetical protein